MHIRVKWKPAAFRTRGSPILKWENDTNRGLKVTKICHWKKQAKSRLNGNGSLSRLMLIKSCSADRKRRIRKYQGTGTLVAKYNSDNSILVFPRAYHTLVPGTEGDISSLSLMKKSLTCRLQKKCPICG